MMEEMGKRKLAYDINYISEGYYVLMKFTSAPDFPAELDRILGITDGVIRSLITMSMKEGAAYTIIGQSLRVRQGFRKKLKAGARV